MSAAQPPMPAWAHSMAEQAVNATDISAVMTSLQHHLPDHKNIMKTVSDLLDKISNKLHGIHSFTYNLCRPHPDGPRSSGSALSLVMSPHLAADACLVLRSLYLTLLTVRTMLGQSRARRFRRPWELMLAQMRGETLGFADRLSIYYNFIEVLEDIVVYRASVDRDEMDRVRQQINRFLQIQAPMPSNEWANFIATPPPPPVLGPGFETDFQTHSGAPSPTTAHHRHTSSTTSAHVENSPGAYPYNTPYSVHNSPAHRPLDTFSAFTPATNTIPPPGGYREWSRPPSVSYSVPNSPVGFNDPIEYVTDPHIFQERSRSMSPTVVSYSSGSHFSPGTASAKYPATKTATSAFFRPESRGRRQGRGNAYPNPTQMVYPDRIDSLSPPPIGCPPDTSSHAVYQNPQSVVHTSMVPRQPVSHIAPVHPRTPGPVVHPQTPGPTGHFHAPHPGPGITPTATYTFVSVNENINGVTERREEYTTTIPPPQGFNPITGARAMMPGHLPNPSRPGPPPVTGMRPPEFVPPGLNAFPMQSPMFYPPAPGISPHLLTHPPFPPGPNAALVFAASQVPGAFPTSGSHSVHPSPRPNTAVPPGPEFDPNSGSDHWAAVVFAELNPTYKFTTPGTRSTCYGLDESDISNHLARSQFVEVLQVKFTTESLIVRIYCRQSDNRSRMMITYVDDLGRTIKSCHHLTSLQIRRHGSTVELAHYRPDNTQQPWTIWARLSFASYERLVVFATTLVCIKRQDRSSLSLPQPLSQDFTAFGETPEFEGEIKDLETGSVQTCRIYHDPMSNGVRVESGVRHGPREGTPLWTGFITRLPPGAAGPHPVSIHQIGPQTVDILGLRPHVFCNDFPIRTIQPTPGTNRHGGVRIEFTSSQLADSFIQVSMRLLSKTG